jgi:glycosyltransferase involved in cell wall biosynthesis
VLARPAFSNRRVNPYNHLLYSELVARGVRVDEYSPARALGRYDVVHVHWPESVFNASLPEALITTGSLLAAVDLLRRRGAKLVWTAHNLGAHERKFPAPEQRFLRAFLAKVDGFIALGASNVSLVRERYPELAERPAFVVPHHHYGDEYACDLDRSLARRELGLPEDARVFAFVGRIAAYKGLPALLERFAELDDSDPRPLRLLVAGRATDPATLRRARHLAARDGRVSLWEGHASNLEVGRFVRASDLVVLPYREILNSGSAVLAQSLGRPVLLPRAGSFSDLERLFGSDFVFGYDQLDAGALAVALARALAVRDRSNRDRLAALSPASAAERTLEAYRAVLEVGRAPARASA